jgi:hypothetical protein
LDGGAGGSATTSRKRKQGQSLADTLGEFLQDWIENAEESSPTRTKGAETKKNDQGQIPVPGNKGGHFGDPQTFQTPGKSFWKGKSLKSEGKG